MNGTQTSSPSSIEGKKVRDFITLKPYEGIYTVDKLSPETIVQSYIFTSESIRNFLEIFTELSKDSGTDRKSIIITGDRGVGKTHSLTVIREIIRDPSLASLVPSAPIQNVVNKLRQKKFIIVEIRCQINQEESLKELFYQAFRTAHLRYFNSDLPPVENWLELEDSDEQIQFICNYVPNDYEIIILLDDISEKLISYRNITKIIGDLEFLLTMSLATSLYPIFMVCTIFENLLTPPSYTTKYNDLHQKLLDHQLPNSFHIKQISKGNMLELINRNIILKSEDQKKQLESLYQYFFERVPSFRNNPALFHAVYPIHPLSFQVSFYLHRYIKNFSLLPFIYSTANRILGLRCTTLVTIDQIFDLFYHEFKKVPDLLIALQSYETISKQAIPNLAVPQRLPARLILKALFLLSITEEFRPTLENISDALLLTAYQNSALTNDDLLQILNQFEEQTPQCIRRITRAGQVEFQLVTIDHTSLDFIIQAVLKEEAAPEEKIQRILFQAFFQLLDSLNIGRENYNVPVSVTPIEIPWRGTLRKGIANWAERADQIAVPALELRTHSILHELSEKSSDGHPLEIPALPGSDQPVYATTKVYDWQLLILSPLDEKHTPHVIKELGQRYPTLMVFKPGDLSEEERQKFATAAILFAEEYRYRFFDLEEEYLNRRNTLETEIHDIVRRKYFHDGLLFFLNRSLSLEEVETRPENFFELLQRALKQIFDLYFPLHPSFKSVLPANLNQLQIAEVFLKQPSEKPAAPEFLENFLVPLGLIQHEGSSFIFNPESDHFLESPCIADQLYLIGSYPATVFPLPLFYHALASPPFGLQPPIIDLIMIALVAAGKIKIFQSNRGDLDGITRMSLTSEIDLSFFDSVQAIEEKTLPLPELLQWGYILCNTRMDSVGGLSQSRKHLKNLLQEWLEFEKTNSLDNLIQTIPNDLLTNHMGREVQSSHRNSKAIETIIENICNQQYNLEDGLSMLARAFSNNLRAFQSVLGEIHNIREFLGWAHAFIEAKTYILTSEKTKDQFIENLRYELSNFFERPIKLIDPERRQLFQHKFQEFKKAFITLYREKHDLQLTSIGPSGKLAAQMKQNWWKNLPTLSRISYVNQYHIRSLLRLLLVLQERECYFPVAQILEQVPRCRCGFQLYSADNIDTLAVKTIETAERAKEECQKFLTSYKKLIIREMQKISSLDDDTARQVVNLINGNLDAPVSLDAVKLINFILKRKIKPLTMRALTGQHSGEGISRNEILQNLAKFARELEESKEVFYMLEGEE